MWQHETEKEFQEEFRKISLAGIYAKQCVAKDPVFTNMLRENHCTIDHLKSLLQKIEESNDGDNPDLFVYKKKDDNDAKQKCHIHSYVLNDMLSKFEIPLKSVCGWRICDSNYVVRINTLK